MSKQWFDVDKDGLGRQVEQHGKGRLVGELIQNALDEEGVTRIDVTLAMIPGRPLADLRVEDDSPEGFRDLSHAYTLFAPSYKRTNPKQRGQYNFGEKLVLAACVSASITTTKGAVFFNEFGRTAKPRQRRTHGTLFHGELKMTRAEYQEACDYVGSLLLPDGITVTFNGNVIKPRQPLHTFEASLETAVADEEGVMRPRTLKTTVGVYEPFGDEVPSLYEMGLPVVETGDKWHVSVNQKIPLNRDRDNVKPSFLRAVRTLVLNEMHYRIYDDEANDVWVRQASSDPNCSPAAMQRVMDLRFGEKRASYDPSDPEANKAFVAKGGTLVFGSMLNGQEWQNARKAEAIRPAGHLCPTAKPYSQDPNADPADFLSPDQWTEGMTAMARYAVMLAQELMGVGITVQFVKTSNNFAACYGGRRLDFNVTRLGRKWFDQGPTEKVDGLLIHEFGHEYSGDHLSETYYDALCELGAKLKRLALDKPELFRG